ncbi:flagellar FlbD family protein [Desertibacillus haloalkaliphilus]|uniref:flagellar FlbD family protein n=1 Tax=Desertibacillus haloalkaliphilus TaxID=1328930 RepID=UPI001C27D152|nr:flagellar FlbD family protein [Desertibacillus haloalkaliphilus]MBU8907005.1 flagellar FlbD family protein [Desertibacillus haloalkaliphilus]
MITLTRLNGQKFLLNALLIEQVQSFPDTTITLTNGNKIVVLDSEEDVMLKINNLYKSIGLIAIDKDAGGS